MTKSPLEYVRTLIRKSRAEEDSLRKAIIEMTERERTLRENRYDLEGIEDRLKNPASAIEAGTAETAGLGAKHESAVPQGDAPNPDAQTPSKDIP